MMLKTFPILPIYQIIDLQSITVTAVPYNRCQEKFPSLILLTCCTKEKISAVYSYL